MAALSWTTATKGSFMRSVASRLAAPAVRLARRTIGTFLRELPRVRKAAWQRRHYPAGTASIPLFVVGCQRSGTTMVLEVLDRSGETSVFHEYHRAAMEDFRLRAPEVIDRIVDESRAPVVVFKPITESQWTDRLLERHPQARAIWLFRRYQDVANSALAKWPGTNTTFVDAIREGEPAKLGWQTERISPEVQAVVNAVGADLSQAEGAAMFWYARNQLYFEQDLAHDPRVLLVQYEQLVQDPEGGFRRIFEFAGATFDPAFVRDVAPTSLGRRTFGPIRDSVKRICDEMMSRLVSTERALAGRGAQDPVTD